MTWTILSKYNNWLVLNYLVEVRAFSDRLLKDVKRNGKILVNGENVTVRKRLFTGDRLTVIFGKEVRGKGLKSIEMPLNIVYEDEHFIVLNKPRGLAIMNDGKKPTLVDGVLHYFESKNIPYTVHVVTRLDRDTSGLVLIAKHRYAHHLLLPENITREYLALVEGILKKKSGMINLPIGRSPSSIIERMVTENGKRAVTHYEVTQEYVDCSLLKLNLETGRTHQIRVHLSFIGHPLIGDDLYGGDTSKLNGQALHCHKLTFIHPFLKRKMIFIAQFP
ncbi:RluA family pseudouridine synthase [Bacillaceae bacterium W0354]